MGTVSDVITGGTEGAVQQGPVRARVLKDLSAEEKERYKADIRATNILLQGIPKDIYSLINHYTDAKDIWENVKMILEGSELTKDDRESQLYDEFEHFLKSRRNIQGLKESNCDQLYAYLKQHEVHANENRIMMERFGQPNNDFGTSVGRSVAGKQVTNVDDDVDDSQENDLALNVDHIFEADECDAFDSDVDEGPTSQTMFMALLTIEDPIYDEAVPSTNRISIWSQDHDAFVDLLDVCGDNEDMLYICNASLLRNDALMSILDEMHEQGVQIKEDEEVTLLKKDFKQKEDKFLEEFLDIKKLKDKIEDRLYKQDQSVQTVHMLCQPNHFMMKGKESKLNCEAKSLFLSDYVKPKVLAPGMYAIDVQPIPHPLKNNRSAHLNYISHLKESVETVREIVEEARIVKPLDISLNYACRYTKLSQELLECVIGTCPKSFNERDNKAPSTPVTRKKQVTFSDKPGTSSSNAQKYTVHQRVQLTNIPVLPSTGVNDSTEASGSKPRSNTKKNRILPAKKENKKEVEVRLRTNKSVWTKVNRVDSSISSKRVVINSNSESVNSASHGMCVVNILNSVNATPAVRILLNKVMLWYLDSGCSKHMTGNRSKLMNFVEKFIGSVRFGNDHLGAIMGYGDYVMGDSVISRVYYVEGLGTSILYILKGSRGTNLYTISIDDMMKSSPICLLSKASKSKSWLWHRRFKPFKLGNINDLAE
ncbi:hypothetical protein Tco_1154182 [Tanacetum coccineum]